MRQRGMIWIRSAFLHAAIRIHWVVEQVDALGYGGDYALEFEVGDIEPAETGYKKWYETWKNA